MDKQLLPLLYLVYNFLPVPLITATVVIDVVAGHGSVITYDSLTWMWLLIPILAWLIGVAPVLQRTKRSQIFNLIDFWKVPYLVQSQPLPVHIHIPLLWRHYGRGSVSNHQPHDCLLNRLFRRRSRKHQSSASLAFVWGIHRGPVNSPHK